MMGNPFGLERAIPRAVSMLQDMVSPSHIVPDEAIPLTLIRHCEGIAFIRIFKAGFFVLGGNVGGGCVIAKIPDPSEPLGFRWSAPIAIVCGGLGGGFIFGGEQIDSVVILNTKGAVRAFGGEGQVTFGGNVSAAVGPVGKDIEAHVGASSNKEIVAAYSYSRAKGAYIGGTLEGAILLRKDEENKKFYENPNATAENILNGTFRPPFKAIALGDELNLILQKKGSYSGIKDTPSQADLAKSGRELIQQGLSSTSDDEQLPPNWSVATSPDGKKYYYNTKTQETQWDKPNVPTPVVSKPPEVIKPALPPRPNIYVTSLYAYDAQQPDELSFKVGDKIEVVEKVDENWIKGKLRNKTGLVPANYVKH